jgi:hypothetical protein
MHDELQTTDLERTIPDLHLIDCHREAGINLYPSSALRSFTALGRGDKPKQQRLDKAVSTKGKAFRCLRDE